MRRLWEDALGPISAEALSVRRLFRKGTFDAARSQRDYQWTDRECGQLLADLYGSFTKAGLNPDAETLEEAVDVQSADPTEQTDEPATPSGTKPPIREKRLSPTRQKPPQHYFLGPVVLYRRPQLKDGYTVYDGQQRLTTLSLLLAALRDQLRESDWLEVQELLRTTDERKLPRLEIKTPGGSLRRITGMLDGTRWQSSYANQSPADYCMYAAASLFRDRIKDWSPALTREFTGFLCERVFLSATYVEDPLLAHIIFETANTRGLALKPGDILKGHLVQLVSEYGGSTLAQSTADNWERTRRKLGRRFDDYLLAVDFVKFGKPRSNQLGSDLLEEFDGQEGANKAVAWVTEWLPRYCEDFLPINRHLETDIVQGADISFRQLGFLNWKEWQAVAMAIHNRWGTNPQAFALKIQKLQQACFIMHLLGWSDKPDRRAHALSRAIDQIDAGRSPFPSPNGTGSGALCFKRERKSQARGALRASMREDSFHGPIVRWLETLRWGDAVPRQPVSNSSVEHVLPRAAGIEWTQDFPDEAQREDYKNKLGNFCLLPADIDRALRNASFKTKRAAYLAQPELYRSCREVAAFPRWNPAAIEQRTEELARRAEEALCLVTPAPSSP
jgi:hypothetical protein